MGILEEIEAWQSGRGREIFEKMGVRSDSVCIDFGCGHGDYTCTVARAAGVVYAVDISRSMIDNISEISKRKNLNIKPILSDGKGELKFAHDNSVDFIMIYDLIHDISDIFSTLMNECHRVLKNTGKLSILPFHMSENEITKMVQNVQKYNFSSPEIFTGDGVHFGMHKFSADDERKFSDLWIGNIYNFSKI